MRKTTPKPPQHTVYFALNVISVAVLFGVMALGSPAPSPIMPPPTTPGQPHMPLSLASDTGHSPEPPSPSNQKPVQNPAAAPQPTPAASRPAAAPVKYPGLPDYPHPQYEYRTLATPSGPLYSLEPFLARIEAEAGWDAATSANPPPIVAVIDTGFSLNHVNLSSRWALNSGEVQGSLVDNDSDGYVGNWRGWDFVHNSPNPTAGVDYPSSPTATHGTLTAGLAGLLDSEATIMPLQALDDAGGGYTDEVAAAIRYAADHGAKVINLSLGTTYDDAYLRAQIAYAISKGALVVAAAGNNDCNCMLYPAAYPEVLSVGAATATDTRASFSSYGVNLDVLAPGTAGDVCSSLYLPGSPTTEYSCAFAGTSFATPIVAGLASLLFQLNPTAHPSLISSAIAHHADQVPAMLGASKTLYEGYGRINVANSVAAITAQTSIALTNIANSHSTTLATLLYAIGPDLATACSIAPTAVCSLQLSGPNSQTINIGQTATGTFNWAGSWLALVPGEWVATAVVTNGSTTISTVLGVLEIYP